MKMNVYIGVIVSPSRYMHSFTLIQSVDQMLLDLTVLVHI